MRFLSKHLELYLACSALWRQSGSAQGCRWRVRKLDLSSCLRVSKAPFSAWLQGMKGPGENQEALQQELAERDGPAPFLLQGGQPLSPCGPSLTGRLLLSVQLFAMIFAMCLFRGIQ